MYIYTRELLCPTPYFCRIRTALSASPTQTATNLLALSLSILPETIVDGERAWASISVLVFSVVDVVGVQLFEPVREQEEGGVDVHVAVLSDRDHGEAGERSEGAEFQGGEGEGLSGDAARMLEGEVGQAPTIVCGLYCSSFQVVSRSFMACPAVPYGCRIREIKIWS